MARIVQFEGRRVQVPDDATDAEIEEILTGQPAAPAAQPEASAPVAPVAPEDVRDARGVPGGVINTAPAQGNDASIIDTIMNGADYFDNTAANFLRSARRGAASIPGLPVDIVNNAPRLLNVLPGVDNVGPISDKPPFMGGEFIDQALGGFGALPEPPAPQDAFQRGLARIGQEVGAAAVPVGGALTAAARLGVQGARELPYATRMFVEPAAVNPGRFAGREAATATGAGIGAATANELVDPNSRYGQIADIIGAIMGAGVTGIGSAVGSSVNQTWNALRQNPDYLDQVVRDAVTERIGQAAALPGSEVPGGTFDTAPLVRAIDNPATARPSEVIPGYQETLADRTGNPGLAALEYSRQQGDSAGQFVERRNANTEVVDRAMGAIEPQATPGAFREELAIERDRRLLEAIMGRESADLLAESATRGLQPQTTAAQRGSVIRDELTGQRETARERTRAAYNETGINDAPMDAAQLNATLDGAIANLTQVERSFLPEGIINRVRGLADQEGPARLAEATSLRSELLEMQRAASIEPGGRNAARVLGDMAQTVDGFIDNSITPEQRTALEQARGARFDEAEAFERRGDPVAKVLSNYEGGRPRVPDDRVAGEFVNPQAMDRLFTEADTPAVRAAIRDEVIGRADTSSPERINRFMQDYGEQLNRFPGLREEFEAAARARTGAAEAQARELATQRDLGTPENEKGRGTVGRYLQYSDDQAERAIGEVLSAKDPGRAADELLTFVNDSPKAAEGARAAFWRKLKSESQSVDNTQRSMGGKRAWRGDWLKSWLDNPATSAVAERLYRDKPEDLEALRAYADVLDNADLRTRARASSTSGTGQGVSNVMNVENLQSRTYAWMSGRISGTYLATSIAAVVARRAVRGARAGAIERLTDKVLLNPEIARELLVENNPANRAALARKAKGWLGNEASTFVNLMNEEDDETKSKVMQDGQ